MKNNKKIKKDTILVAPTVQKDHRAAKSGRLNSTKNYNERTQTDAWIRHKSWREYLAK